MATRDDLTTRESGTRDSLVELATARFVQDGYARTSVRELARESDRTTGALYGHFRNKADLLAEVIATRIAALEDDFPSGVALAEGLQQNWRRYAERADLRALLLEGAVAARHDPEIRERLGGPQAERLAAWEDRVREHAADADVDPALDLDAFFKLLWAIELGLGVLEAYGIEPPDAETSAKMVARLASPGS
jgi:TetR/AcrR family acrAB operon transcriptional repressor